MAALLKKLDAWEAQREMNVARGQADMSRSKGPGALGVTDKGKLQLGKSAARNMLLATMRKNRAKR